jgi:hypothetical protein
MRQYDKVQEPGYSREAAQVSQELNLDHKLLAQMKDEDEEMPYQPLEDGKVEIPIDFLPGACSAAFVGVRGSTCAPHCQA